MPSVTPDLLPPVTPLVPLFPLSDAARALTLYPAERGELCVHWQLTADAYMTQRSQFPATASTPQVVLRLRRRGINGDCEPIREQPVQVSGLRGSGEVRFDIGDDWALFEAELGLKSAEGGWALLARSNQLQAARGLGLESLTHPPLEVSSPPHPSSTDAAMAVTETQTTDTSASPALWVTAIPVLTYADPAPQPSRVVIEVELLIRGWSAPNTEIDLFGQPYRVGPGGRFQLRVTVEDAELIRRALQQHPLSESITPG